jgi:DNA invertase Pin-like site-specific DNA recombinase
MLLGYARVSTDEQDLALQMDALARAGCERTFTDKASGASNNRPGMEQLLSHIRPGDSLVVWKLDRLGRTVKGLVDMINNLEGKGIQFRSLTDGIDTSTGPGRFFFHIMAALAQMERELISERTRAGLAAAKARDKQGGRNPKMTKTKLLAAKKLLMSGTGPRDVAEQLGISIPTLYRWIPSAAQVGKQQVLEI